MLKTRLRGQAKRRSGPYPLGEIPREAAITVGKQIVHRFAVGHANITGDDFGGIFANAIDGVHRASPLGVADVIHNGCAWSVKTVQDKRPFEAKTLRLISGRNSPDYSHGISNPRQDLSATGRAVLSIWNGRVDEALDQYDDLRVAVLVRNMGTREFVLFEDEARRYIPDNYTWHENKRHNLEGTEISTAKRMFTWQPHGSQFTIHREVPPAARRFRIASNVPIVKFEHILGLVQYKDDWIEFQ